MPRIVNAYRVEAGWAVKCGSDKDTVANYRAVRCLQAAENIAYLLRSIGGSNV